MRVATVTALVALLTGILGLPPAMRKVFREESTGTHVAPHVQSQVQTIVINNPNGGKASITALEVGALTLIKQGEATRYGNTAFPKMQISAQSPSGFHPEAVQFFLGRAREFAPDALPVVPQSNVHVQLAMGQRSLAALLDTSIKADTSAPMRYGYYRAKAQVTDNHGHTVVRAVDFGYTYKETFLPLNRVIVPYANSFANLSDKGGLVITNKSTRGGFCSADICQTFDFKADFCVQGFFTLQSDCREKPASLNIDFADSWGERVAVLLADGDTHSYSIKVYGERWGRLITMDASQTGRQDVDIVADGKTLNYFLIEVLKQGDDESKWSLYIARKEPNPGKDLPVHQRKIANACLGSGSLRMKLKLWGSGILKLYEFDVAELPTGK